MNNESISFYDEQGRITGVVTADPISILLTKTMATQPHVAGDHLDLPVYVAEGGLVQPRPACPARLEGHQILDLPEGASLTIGSQFYRVTGPTAELEFEHPGTYTVLVQAWPYLDKEFTLENPPL